MSSPSVVSAAMTPSPTETLSEPAETAEPSTFTGTTEPPPHPT